MWAEIQIYILYRLHCNTLDIFSDLTRMGDWRNMHYYANSNSLKIQFIYNIN